MIAYIKQPWWFCCYFHFELIKFSDGTCSEDLIGFYWWCSFLAWPFPQAIFIEDNWRLLSGDSFLWFDLIEKGDSNSFHLESGLSVNRLDGVNVIVISNDHKMPNLFLCRLLLDCIFLTRLLTSALTSPAICFDADSWTRDFKLKYLSRIVQYLP